MEMDWKAVLAARSRSVSVLRSVTAEDLLDLAPHRFDGIEVGRIGRQIQQPGACGLDGFADSPDFVRGQIVQDHQVAGSQGGSQSLLPPRPKTFRRSWGLQTAKGRKDPPGVCRRSTCWSDSFRAGCGRPVFVPRGPGRASASFGCWPRFHPQTPARSRAPRPTVHASELFFRPRPAGFVRRRPEFFLYLQPSCRSHKSIVEVRKGRSMRAPNSASVASG